MNEPRLGWWVVELQDHAIYPIGYIGTHLFADNLDGVIRDFKGIFHSVMGVSKSIVWGSYSESPACRRCGGEMSKGQALRNTVRGKVTKSRTGPPKLVLVLKCKRCGYSITV